MNKPLDLKTALLLKEVYNQNELNDDFFKNPDQVAEKLNIKLDPDTSAQIIEIGKTGLRRNLDETDYSIISKFNDVVKDGRYLTDFFMSPETIEEKLGIGLTLEEIYRIQEYKMEDFVDITPNPRGIIPDPGNKWPWPIPLPKDPKHPFPKNPLNPNPIPDPFPIYGGVGSASLVITVVIGAILFTSKGGTNPPVIDFSGINKP